MREPEFWQALLSLDLSPAKSRDLLTRLGTYCVTARDLAVSSELTQQEKLRVQVEGSRDTSGTHVVALEDEAFPANLRPVSNPPVALMVRGSLLPEDSCAVAIVGTRKPSPYGRAVARRLAMELAKNGITVVSGAANGIDSEAHTGALQVGGRTIAVLGSGVDRPYPASNIGLLRDIERSGAVVSQFALGTKPDYWRFPMRNATIAGLARAVVLVEVPEASGALVTASIAAEEGRHTFVTPGPVDSITHRGSFRLINDGATLLYTPDQVFEALGIERKAAPATNTTTMSPGQKRIYEALSSTPELADNLSERLGQPAAVVLSELTRLEIEGLVQKAAGGYIKL